MMLKLELCYEQDPSDPNSLLLIPSILEEGRGKPQRWQLNTTNCLYAGRHLECDDSSHTFLTPGFFPRLQAIFLSFLPSILVFVCHFCFPIKTFPLKLTILLLSMQEIMKISFKLHRKSNATDTFFEPKLCYYSNCGLTELPLKEHILKTQATLKP